MSEVIEEKKNTNAEFKEVMQLLQEQARAIKERFDLEKLKKNIAIQKAKFEKDKNKYKELLQFQYQRKLLNDSDPEMSKLNEMEASSCNLKCQQVQSVPSAGMRVDMFKEYPVKKYFDESRQKDIYTFFVDIEIKPEEQIDSRLEWKIKQGFLPQESDFKPTKIHWARYSLNEKEFFKYFKIVD